MLLPLGPNVCFRRVPELFVFWNRFQSIPHDRFRGVDQLRLFPRATSNISGAQAGPQGPAVTARGECLRIMYAGQNGFKVKQTWSPHKCGLKLTTTLINPRVKGRVRARSTRSNPCTWKGLEV